ncbi:YafY family protein [uncultured Methylibium sp.]|uniref:helix-turn-helix transcriptional regulator n=1 Tax=uncultured Methylibium sp. TaxID=381093 RepID=UPI0025CD9A6C|nr:YafY family protein [uncultured Methylibium sp.]
MRASRLLSIQMLLQTRGRLSARALAEALEVSIRTLYRDVDELSAAGVPIYAERGRSGGFELLPGWKTTLTGLTPSEAQAVFLSGLAGPAAELGLAADVERAQLKLLAALPAPWRDGARRTSSRLYLDPVDWYREADDLPQLQRVASAVWDERQLAIRYESWQQTTRRTVHPLGLVLKAGAWYLVAMAVPDQKPRTYRVSNILEADVLEAAVRRPPRFDLAAHWRASVQRFEAELHRGEARVLATPLGLKSLGHLSSAVARAARAAAPSRRADGRHLLTIPIESIEHATGQLLRLAPDVEVMGPVALRRSMVERIRQLAVLYGTARVAD